MIKEEALIGGGLAFVVFILEIIRSQIIGRFIEKQPIYYDEYPLVTSSKIAVLLFGFIGSGFVIAKTSSNFNISTSFFLITIVMLFCFLLISRLRNMEK